MARYGYTVVVGNSPLVIRSTDSALLEWLLVELRKTNPSASVRSDWKLSSGELFCRFIDNLERVQRDGNTWLAIKLLCSQGWEPIAPGIGATGLQQIERFRKKYDDGP